MWGSTFAGRMDVKMDRKSGTLNILHLHLETSKADDFIIELKKALDKFLTFNKGSSIEVFKITSDRQTMSKAMVNSVISTLIT